MQILNIATYNILANAFVKKDRYPYSSPEALDPMQRRQRLYGELDSLDADIYCLQEVEPDAYREISGHFGAAFGGVYAARTDAADGLAIFYKRSLTLRDSQELRDTSHGRGNELAGLVATFEFDGAPLGVVSTHLRWRPAETPLEEHTGLKQLSQILDRCDADAIAWVIAGDFNANSESKVIAAADARGHRISCLKQRPWDTTNINGRRRKIDYLLHAPERLVPTPGQLPKLEKRTPMPSEQHSSDHLPLTVSFQRR